MSDPIRRVGGAASPGTAEVPGGGEAFRATLEAAREVDPAGATRGSADAAGLAAAVRSGELSPAAVVDSLVERALAAPAAQALSAPARADLERALRGALAEDPTLLAMQADLGR